MFEKVIVTDDDPKITAELSLILTKSNFIVVPCRRKQEALRMIKTMSPIACFLDISLNGSLGEEGIEIAKEISGNGKRPAIFLMSRYPEDYFSELDRLVKKNLIQGLLKKPFSPEAIQKLINKIQSRHQF